MTKQPKKKKRSRVSKTGNAENHPKNGDDNEQRVLKHLVDAFGSVSVKEAALAYAEANSDPNKAAEIILTKSVAQEPDQITTCSSSSGYCDVGSSSSSTVSEVLGDPSNFVQDGFKQKGKPKSKKVIASAGTVSTVLGKDYVRSIPKKGSSKLNGFHEERWCKDEAEQFLCSMLGDDSELSLAVVSDVLSQCGYNIDKALDVLLEMSTSSREQAISYYESSNGEDQHLLESSNDLVNRTSDSTNNIWSTGNLFRNLSNISESHENHNSTETGSMVSELPQKVLESLFNMPTPKTAEHEPTAMNWRNVVKKMTSLGQRIPPQDSEQQQQLINAKGDEYRVLRESAQQHWNSMKSYYQKAVTAFTSGEKEFASYLSDQGRLQNKMAREADEKASQDIFTARNKSIENMITIDLHGQHIKPGMKLLKLHLLFGACVRSVRSFRVITGCGSHGVGKSKLKNSVIDLLKKEGIKWSEENRGTLLIKLEGQTNFSFLDSGSDSD
ncbi:smr (Small MutS Related) domain-containing protein [Striga asiatica]|uniref:Smr (Small MutS Related) domain-containing protein n=1 Tax=Striga asiatica TaxID=4170 RepID=A0A5A7P5P1_STRAF|nr:smr (Small MutS Related) domain-containing protein [Striga asiatica]